MPFLRSIILFALLATCGVKAQTAALAPDSLGGYSYYAEYGVASLREFTEASVEFNADGTFVEHWIRPGTAIIASVYGLPANFAAPEEGNYVYTKQSDSQGLLVFNPSTGASVSWTMTFAAEGTGKLSDPNPEVGYDPPAGYFVLQKLDPSTRPLVNISTLMHVHSGESTTVGFVVSHAGDYLIRVAGPALANLGIANPWATPAFTLYAGGQAKVLAVPGTGIVSVYSQPWDSMAGLAATNARAFLAVGAFAFPAGSKDAAAVVYLGPGAYTIGVNAAATDPGGMSLIEVYNYQ
jgi:hypothetical protein